MRGLSSMEVLALWEAGLHENNARRAVTWLATACKGEPVQALAELPLGQRDARLLELRERTFGSRISGLAICPACGEQVQADFEIDQVRTDAAVVGPPGRVNSGGYSARFRLPDTVDLEAAAEAPDAPAARQILMQRCIIEPRRADGTPVAMQDLPPAFVTLLAREIATADPQADVELALNCPGCRHEWTECFDIAKFLWVELQECARRLLGEVHELASAYGWNEEAILSLTPARRAAYLDMVRG